MLTFYEETMESANDASIESTRRQYNKMKDALYKLSGIDKGKSMILLLHGPGGSGKSFVINVVLVYAKEYCQGLGHPFTKYTIIITAMSGVAATLINGETTHSIFGLNRSKVSNEEIEFMADTRLNIIDEVSFFDQSLVKKLDKQTRKMFVQQHEPFGGRHMIFSGDFAQLETPKKDPIYKNYVDYHNNHCS